MSTFTPGPWLSEWTGDARYGGGNVSTPSGEPIAIVCGSNWGAWRDSEDDGEAEFQANAALISAAPDMYEALRTIVLLDADPQPGLFSWQEMRNKAKIDAINALKKAEGKS